MAEGQPMVGGSPTSYRALQGWARSAVWVFYGDVEVTADQELPPGRPTIFAANHSNALADVAVLVAKMPQFPRFLATATWWGHAPARLLFRAGGVLPVDRSRDGADHHHNTATFDACRSALALGDHIAIFPEGELNIGSSLLPIHTGAARIGLGAAAGGVSGVVIVPVGLVYEDRGRFRSGVEMRFGVPIEMDDWVDRYREDPNGAVHGVTGVLAERLAAVTVNSAEEAMAALVRRATAMVMAERVVATGDTVPIAERNALSRRLAAALDSGDRPGGAGALEAAVAVHAEDLARLGFADPQPLEDTPEPGWNRQLAELAVLSPVALVGTAVTAPTVLSVSLLNRLVRHDGWTATIEAVGGTLLLPITGVIGLTLGTRRFGAPRAMAAAVAGAASGVASLYWFDRFREFRALSLIARARVARADEVAQAQRSRAEVRRQVELLIGVDDVAAFTGPLPSGS